MRKPRKYETTCTCRAYKFPHRFGGGRCTGRWIVAQTWDKTYGSGVCQHCNLRNDTEDTPYCEVLSGGEPAKECPEWQEYVGYNEIRIYPAKKY